MKTEYFDIFNGAENIWCAYDFVPEERAFRPLVIVTPGYERTARDTLMLSCYLTLNGFNVLRFDARNSTGLSSGTIEKFTLSSLTRDIETVVDYASRNLQAGGGLSIMAVSLSTRALIKYLAQSGRNSNVSVVVSIVGVVDTAATILKIVNEDYFTGFRNGKRYGTRRFMTYDVDWDNFLFDLYGNKYESLETSLEDARNIDVPLWASITTSEDEWVEKEHQEMFLDSLGHGKTERLAIDGASHKIWKNPKTAQLSMNESIRILRKHILKDMDDSGQIQRPDITDIIVRNRREREEIRRKSQHTGGPLQ